MNQVSKVGSRPAEEHASVDDLASRLQQVEGISEELAHKLADNWKRFAGAVVCVMLGVWLVGEVRQASERRSADAALKLASVAEASQALALASGDGAQDVGSAERAFADNLEALNGRRTPEFYKDSAIVYRALDLARQGKFAEAQDLLSGLGNSVGADAKLNAAEFVGEFAALAEIRLKLNAENPDLGAARSSLKQLVANSNLVSVEALLLLARISESTEERAEVSELSKRLSTEHPEYVSVLESGLTELGMSNGLSN